MICVVNFKYVAMKNLDVNFCSNKKNLIFVDVKKSMHGTLWYPLMS